VTPQYLQGILRFLGETEPTVDDGELLKQFITTRSDMAFAELVRRHARLVWSACRHLSRSEAEADDAFQATFLVLIQNAAKIRNACKLSSWLHGVAYKVCARMRSSNDARKKRETAKAKSEPQTAIVSESAWDRAIASVHEELAKLPESLRVPFVMCCLEGKGVQESAEQLGWKIGTFSGRLSRAKDAILARLETRGLTLGVVAGIGLTVPSAILTARTITLAKNGVTIPQTVSDLSHGVLSMSMKTIQVLAASFVLVCGLGTTIGSAWLANADAQTSAPPPTFTTKPSPEAELKRLQAEIQRLEEEVKKQSTLRYTADLFRSQIDNKTHSAKTTKWEYDFVAVSELERSKFMELLQDYENRGWEYNGLTMYKLEGKQAPIWVFRRPAKEAGNTSGATSKPVYESYFDVTGQNIGKAVLTTPDGLYSLSTRYPATTTPNIPAEKQVEAAKIEAEIKALQAKLEAMKTVTQRRVYPKEGLPLSPKDYAEVLYKFATAKFTKSGDIKIASSEQTVTVEGTEEAVKWADEMHKKLTSGK